MMVSKVGLRDMIRAYDWKGAAAALDERPDLLGFRDERERNWLHVLCAAELAGRKPQPAIKTADMLLARGIDIHAHAFTEGQWKATPVWFCVSRGRNLALAEHLLKLGASPLYAMFAACWNDDLDAIDLLVKYGAPADDHFSAQETPFLGAIAWSRFRAAGHLIKRGANPNSVTPKRGETAFHLMLKKSSDYEHFAALAKLGVRGDIPDAKGVTAASIMARKKDERFRKLAKQLAG